MSDPGPKPDNRVGYGRPPEHSRWKPGQSGNPRGRKKGARGLRTDLHAELGTRMTIQINGRPETDTKQRLMLKTLSARAAAGDLRASAKLFDIALQIFGPEDRGASAARLPPQDQALLEQLLAERLGDVLSLPAPQSSEDPDDGSA